MWAAPRTDRLRSGLAQLAEGGPGRWAFAVWEQGQPVVSLNGAEPVPAASTIKVPLLVLALQDVAAGRRDLDDDVPVPAERAGGAGVLRLLPSVGRLRFGELLTLMIAVSDNAASNLVIELLGLDDADQRLAALGLTGTRLRRRLMDAEAARAGLENVTTADDQSRLLDRLAGPDLLPAPLRAFALGVLAEQQVNDRMPTQLGDDVRCLHKTGELPGVRHDVGLLEFDGRTVALAALGTELTDPVTLRLTGSGPAGSVIGAAARMVVEVART